MAASRTSPALVTAATLALVAAAGAAIVIYRSASTSKKSGSNGAATDSARSAMTGRDQDEVRDEGALGNLQYGKNVFQRLMLLRC